MRPPYASWIDDPDDPDFFNDADWARIDAALSRSAGKWRDDAADAAFNTASWRNVKVKKIERRNLDEDDDDEEDYDDSLPFDDKRPFDESRVSRGQPENAGQFGPGGYGSKEKANKARKRAKGRRKERRTESQIAHEIRRLRERAGSDEEINLLFSEKRVVRNERIRMEREQSRQAAERAAREPIRSRSTKETLARAHESGRSVAEQVEYEEEMWRKSPEGVKAQSKEVKRIRNIVEQGAREWEEHVARREGTERVVRPMSLSQKITVARENNNVTEMNELIREQRARAEGRRAGDPPAKKDYKLEKAKKPAVKEDFDKAGIRLINVASEEEFTARWNEKIGIDPDTFKHAFTGGLSDQVKMTMSESAGIFYVSGRINDEHGTYIGTFDRHLKPNEKSAYSAYFKMEEEAQGSNVGKKLLAGNVDVYEALGYDNVKVSANIDIGGYAWARYGYVPTPQSWASLKQDLKYKIRNNEGHRLREGGGSDSSYEADDWDMLSRDQQEETQRLWMRDSRSEFVDSEVRNWRDNGDALEQTKRDLASEFGAMNASSEWAREALTELNSDRKLNEDKPFPFTDDEIMEALSIGDYESKYNNGDDDPEFEWDNDSLDEAGKSKNPDQMTLPGVEVQHHKVLTDEMREEIEGALTRAFNVKASDDADKVEPPEYIYEQIEEYQDEFWSSKSDREKLRLAIDYGQAQIETEDDGETTEEVALDLPKDEEENIMKWLNESDPKNIWKIADSSRGKELLINSGWSGVLDFHDKESYDRFRKYVSRKKKPKGEQSAQA